MKVNDLLRIIQEAVDNGKGDYDVVYTDECGFYGPLETIDFYDNDQECYIG